MQYLHTAYERVERFFADQTPKQVRTTLCLFLVALTAVVYWQVSFHEFLNYDDQTFVYQNPHVYTGLSFANLRWAFTTLNGGTSYYHPLTWLTHQLDCQLFGTHAGGHHLTNLCLHLANTVLLLITLHSLTGALWRSFLVAALFALHPLHIETVAWISERKSLLCTFFSLLTIRAYGQYATRRRVLDYLLVAVWFSVGLLSKPFAVTIPFVLLLLDFWPLDRTQFLKTSSTEPYAAENYGHRQTLISLVVEKLPLFAVSAVACWLTVKAQQDLGAMPTLAEVPFDQRLRNSVVAYFLYLKKLILPLDLAVIYPLRGNWPWWQVAGSAVALLSVTAIVMRYLRRHPPLFVGWLIYLGTLVPVIGVVQAGSQGMADRYTYLSLVGIFLMLAWASPIVAEKTARARVYCNFATASAIVLSALSTASQVGYWKNSVLLFEHATRSTRANSMAEHNLALALSMDHNPAEAEYHLFKSLRIHSSSTCQRSLAGVLFDEGQFQEAFFHYDVALQMKPSDPETHAALANLYENCPAPPLQDLAKAVYHAMRACQLTHYQKRPMLLFLAKVSANAKQYRRASFAAQKALEASVSPQEFDEAREVIAKIQQMERCKSPSNEQ